MLHFSPEQIDRQPFRMRLRGYDVVQVRNFLREIAQEMRDRDAVRERLVETGDPDEVMGRAAREIIENAEAGAERIVAEAEAGAERIVAEAEAGAERIVAEAEAEADAIVETAEQHARDRSAAVLAETQSRLDQLLAEEREVHLRIAAGEARDARPEPSEELVPHPVPDSGTDDASFADFVKDRLRQELRPD